MKKLLLPALIALAYSPLEAQILSYDFEEGDGLFRNEGTLDSPFDLKGSDSVRGADNSGVGGHGHALDLTGSPEMGGADGLQVFNATKVAFPAQKAMTVTGWYQTPEGVSISLSKSGAVIIRASESVSGTGQSSGFFLGSASDGRMNLFIGTGEGPVYLSSEKGAFAEEGKWVFFAVAWDGATGSWAWYVGSEGDKVRQAGTGTNPATMIDGPVGGLRVGRSNSASGAFKGLLDHIQVYDRALSETEIEQIRSTQASGH